MTSGHEQIGIDAFSTHIVLSLTGQFVGGEETDVLRETITALLPDQLPIIINMSRVSFANSSFLGALLAAHTSASRRGVRFAVAGLSASMSEVFSVTRLDRALSVHQDIPAAVAAVTSELSTDQQLFSS
jgi:anti-anti-sigma factor